MLMLSFFIIRPPNVQKITTFTASHTFVGVHGYVWFNLGCIEKNVIAYKNTYETLNKKEPVFHQGLQSEAALRTTFISSSFCHSTFLSLVALAGGPGGPSL